MRIAALYDIHGNISALKAVLHEISADQVDAVVIGGDVAWGPHPRAAIECLTELDVPATFIRGNADREVSEGIGSGVGGDNSDPDVFLQITDWCRQQLSELQRNWIGSQSLTATLVAESLGEILSATALRAAMRRSSPRRRQRSASSKL